MEKRFSIFSHQTPQSVVYYKKNPERRDAVSMAVTLNKDAEMVAQIRQGLKRTGGYCPCRVQRTEENKCICQEFRQQMADPSFEGYCHCMLYYKSKD